MASRVTHFRVVSSVLELIGATPMVELARLRRPGEGTVFAKLEFLNPGGSVKDRTALGMIEAAERAGDLRSGSTIVEPTAGNTGVGLALIGRLRGYPVVMVVPEGFAREKVEVMKLLGARVVRTPADEGMQGAIRRAQQITRETPGAFCPQQFANPANPEFHYRTTAREIWEQMDGRVDAVCIGAGTGGTFTGVARYLRERAPKCRMVLVEPQGSVFGGGKPGKHKVEGIGNSFVPETLDRSLADEVMTIDDGASFGMVRRLAAEEGILAGGSGGCAAEAAVRVARRLGEAARIVTVIPDGFERNLSKWEG